MVRRFPSELALGRRLPLACLRSNLLLPAPVTLGLEATGILSEITISGIPDIGPGRLTETPIGSRRITMDDATITAIGMVTTGGVSTIMIEIVIMTAITTVVKF